MTVDGRMLNDKSGKVRLAAGVECRQPDHLQSGAKNAKAISPSGCGILADRSRLQIDRRGIENDEGSYETFTLSLEVARDKVRDVIDRNPQRGYLEIVERWRQRPDGLIEFATRRLPRRIE